MLIGGSVNRETKNNEKCSSSYFVFLSNLNVLSN